MKDNSPTAHSPTVEELERALWLLLDECGYRFKRCARKRLLALARRAGRANAPKLHPGFEAPPVSH